MRLFLRLLCELLEELLHKLPDYFGHIRLVFDAVEFQPLVNVFGEWHIDMFHAITISTCCHTVKLFPPEVLARACHFEDLIAGDPQRW